MTRVKSADMPGNGRPLSRRRQRLHKTVLVLVTLTVLGAAGGGLAWWLTRPAVYRPGEDMPEITRNLARELPEGAPEPRFIDATAGSGLEAFRTFTGPRSSQLPEDMGSGAAWGDFDNDGDDDLFLVSNGGSLEAAPETRAASMLFENRFDDGLGNGGDGTFRVVADFPELRIIGMAAAWGDCDDDGWLDLIVTGFDALLLFRNHEGTLVRDESFVSPSGFWTGASWGDYDQDRDLDLYVCGYVRYTRDDANRARASRQFGTVVPYTLNPASYQPERNLLFRNEGNGAFTEVAEELGVANAQGRSLGALWHDFDQDGRLDLYVANDVSDNAFYRNLGGRFADVSHPAWVADYRGAMGMTTGDYDRDGDDDIFITHWVAQENALYDSLVADLRDRPVPAEGSEASSEASEHAPPWLRYADSAGAKGLGQPAVQMVGWGTEFADLDADGWLDLLIANGSTFETADEPKRLKPQRSFLFWNRAGRSFHDLARYDEVFATPHVSRGLAVSDYDADGDLDVVIMHHGEGVQLIANDMQTGHWIQFSLRSLNRAGAATGFGDGAVVVAQVGDATLRRAITTASYLSQSSRILHVGLGAADRVDRLEVRWLGGAIDVHDDLAAGALWELREGDPEARRLRGADDAPKMTDRERVVEFWAKHRAGMRALKVDEDCDAAIELFRQALALDPSHGDARYYLANCLATIGDTDGAVRELETLLEVDPRSHRTLKRLGVLLAMHSSSPEALAEAVEFLDRALAINREETGVLLALGEIAIMRGDDEQAEERLAWVCRTNAKPVEALFLRGYLAWKHDDEPRARVLLQAAADARGPEWKPEGTTAEGDTGRTMHTELSPLARFERDWTGEIEPDAAFRTLDAELERWRE